MRVSIPNLLPSTNYAIELRSNKAGQVSAWSRRFTFTTAANLATPIAPTGLTWVDAGDSFHAEWQSVSTNSDGNFAKIVRYEVEMTATISTVLYTKNDAVITQDAGKVVYDLSYEQNLAFFGASPAGSTASPIGFRVRAVDSAGLKGAWATATPAANPAPSNVSGLTVSAQYDSIQINWSAAADTDLLGYRVTMSTTGVGGTYNQVYQGPNTSILQPTTNYTTDHFFKVYAIDKFGSSSATPATSGAIRPKSAFNVDATPPGAPTSVTTTAVWDATAFQSYINIAWTAPSDTDLDNYLVGISTNGTNFDYTVVDRSVTSVRIPVTPGKTYYTKVFAKDFSANLSTAGLPSPTSIAAVGNGSAPSIPAAPTIAVNPLQAQVTVSGNKAAGGAMEADVAIYNVYASTTSGFTPAAGNMLGQISATSVTKMGTFDIPASAGSGTTQQWYFKVTAVNSSGLESSPSANNSAAANVPLIPTASIGDAQITNAKITQLSVEKLIAGNGIVQDLVIGNASTPGTLSSYNYVASTTGWRLSKTGLEINDGIIRAPALLIQNSNNIIQPLYADFEAPLASYFYATTNSVAATITLDATFFKYNTQSMKIVTTNATNSVVMGDLAYDNFVVSPSINYIVSYWMMVPTGGTVPTITPKLTFKTGTTTTISGSTSTPPANSTWNRYSTVITSSATAVGPAIFNFSTGVIGTVYIDGIQVEEQMAGSTVPSSWSPPSKTTIDGGLINTGEIRSFNTYTVDGNTQPVWSLNTSGNAQFTNALIRGNTIIGDSSGANSYISSYNYSAAAGTGWIARADGTAEFRQLAANSISGAVISSGTYTADKLGPGTIGADIFIGGNFSAVDRSVSGITNKVVSSNVVTLTTFGPHNRLVGDRVNVAMNPADTTIDTQSTGNAYDIITATTSNSFSYIRTTPNVTSVSVNGTANFLGRSTVMNPAGLHLYAQDGITPLIDLPNSPLLDSLFTGKVNTGSLTIQNNLYVGGTGNLIGSGAVVKLTSQVTPPNAAPSYNASSNYQSLPVPTAITAYKRGEDFDGTYFYSVIYTTQPLIQKINKVDGSTSIITPAGTGITQNGNNTQNGAAMTTPTAFYGITHLGTDWFLLVYVPSTRYSYSVPVRNGGYTTQTDEFPGKWMVYKYSSNTFATLTATYTWTYDSAYGTNVTNWGSQDDTYQGQAGRFYDPALGNDGTNLLLVRGTGDGDNLVRIGKYNSTMVKQSITSTTLTAFLGAGRLGGVVYGSFDLAGPRFIIMSRDAKFNYSLDGTTMVGIPGEHFPTPGGNALSGTATGGITWDGSNFRTQMVDTGRIATYTSLGKATTNMAWAAKMTYYNADSTIATVSNKSLTSNVATLTINIQRYVVGDTMIVSDVGSPFDGTYIVTAATGTIGSGPANVSYAKVNANVTSASATGNTVRDTYETAFSSTTFFTATRRGVITLATTAVQDQGGKNDPKGIRVYISIDNGSTFYRQTEPANGIITQTYVSDPSTAGSTTTSPTLFPAAAAAKILSYAVDVNSNPMIELRGDGSYRLSGTNLDDIPWTAATLTGGWVNFGAPYPAASYCRKDGIVYVKGLVKSGTVGNTVFTLPVGMRPSADRAIACVSAAGSGSATTFVAVRASDGAVYFQVANNTYAGLDNIVFPAEA